MDSKQTTASPIQRASVKTNSKLQFVVGIGASAGGLKSIEETLKGVSGNTGSAFVIIQHISPDIVSSMAEILGRSTHLPIEMIRHDMEIVPEKVYLIPPGEEVRLRGNKFVTNLLDRNVVTKVVDKFLNHWHRRSAVEPLESSFPGREQTDAKA